MSQSTQTSIIKDITGCRISYSQTKTSIDCVNSLDDYSLLLIFSKLSFVEKITAQKVCQKWQQLIDKSILCQNSIGVTISFAVCQDIRHQVSVNECVGDLFESAIEGAVNTKWYFVTALVLSSVLSKCLNLKSLILQNCIFCREVLDVFLKDCSSKLEHLDLSHSSCNISEILQIISEKCSQTLKHVILEDNEINDLSLKCLLSCCKQLEVLILDKNIEITGSCFDLFGDKISYLSIVGCNSIDESGITALVSGNGKNIRHIRIGDSITPSMFQMICEQLLNLKTLEFYGFKSETTNTSNAYNFISNLESLQELILKVPRIVFDNQLISIIRRCHDLRKVKIDGALLTNTSLKQIAVNCPLIEQISIIPLDAVTNNSITDDCRHEMATLLHLKSLSLCGSSITDRFVETISCCPRLTFIELDSCQKISNKSLDIFMDTADRRPKDKLILFIQRTQIKRPLRPIPSNLTVFGPWIL